MCGITGIVNLKKYVREDRDKITDMTTSLTVDGIVDVWFSTFVGFGYKSFNQGGLIQKKANGNMYSIAFCGSLYDVENRRNQLLQKGHIFHTSTVAELALTAYIEWKEQCIYLLDGDFSFVVWDEAKQQLYLICNQLAPLYYLQESPLFLFGTEKKAIMNYQSIGRENIRELSNGHSLLFTG